MSAGDRFLFVIALTLTVFGSIALCAQAQEMVRQASACEKSKLPRVADHHGI